MSNEIIVGLVQMKCDKGASEDNISSMQHYINECKMRNCEIVCFPEMNITGYINPNKYPYAVLSRDHDAVRQVEELSKKYQIAILAGFVEENPDGKPFITQFVAQDGEIIGYYRKKTVKDEEALWFSPGDGVPIFSYNGIKYGLSICADIDDESIFKQLAKKGASIVFECAAPGLYGSQETRNWQSGYEWWRGECINKLGRYASDNSIYIAVSTQAGRTIDEDFPGGGYLFSPRGECIYKSDNWEEGLLFVKLPVMGDYTLDVLSEEYAREICTWRYEGEYSIYDFSDWETIVKNKWSLSIKEKRESEFIAVLLDDDLAAYGRLSINGHKAFIGIGLKPSFCGKGCGKDIMNLLIEESKKKFPGYTVALEVRSFNKRAINCYKSIGFEIKDTYMKKTFCGDMDEFYYMEYMK